MKEINKAFIDVQKVIEQKLVELKRPKDSLQILAVSKKQSIKKIEELSRLGQNIFGENYLQEFKEKKFLGENLKISWHYIGKIQSKKINALVGEFEFIHSLDRLDVAEKISLASIEKGLVQNCLLQINIADEGSKSGVDKEEVLTFFEQCLKFDGISLRGLMVMPPLVSDPEEVRPYFKQAKILFDILKQKASSQKNIDTLSMGTSSDFLVAIEEGATLVRLGTILFGEREEG